MQPSLQLDIAMGPVVFFYAEYILLMLFCVWLVVLPDIRRKR
jgi:hypothetical protein